MSDTTLASIQSDITVLDSLFAVNLNISLWTARRKMTPEDFGGVELPPEDIASLGSKRIANPETLRIFNTIRSRACAFLDRHSVRFLGGWAIAEADATLVVDQLRHMKIEFEKAKSDFLQDYDKDLSDWISQHSQWESIIAKSTVSADYVRNRLGFGWQIYRVSPMRVADQATSSNSGLAEEVQGLAGTLFKEVAREAEDTWHRVFLGKTEVTHKALSPLRTLEVKLHGLSFLEPHAAPLVDIIESAVSAMPKRGNITGSDLLLLQGVVAMLRSPETMLEHSQKVIEGQSASSILNGLTAPRPPQENVIQTATSMHSSQPRSAIPNIGLW